MPEPDPQPHKARPLEILIVDDDKIVHFLHSRVHEQFRMDILSLLMNTGRWL